MYLDLDQMGSSCSRTTIRMGLLESLESHTCRYKKTSYPKRELEPGGTFPSATPRLTSPPLRGDTEIVKERARGGLVTSLRVEGIWLL